MHFLYAVEHWHLSGTMEILTFFFKFCHRYAITKAFIVSFMLTFISVLDVPVFWPILSSYWLFLLALTMKRQIVHMIKYKYNPFSFGKPVRIVYFFIF